MTNHQYTQDLFVKYVSDSITGVELSKLEELVSCQTDEELEVQIKIIWEQQQDIIPLDSIRKRRMFSKIEQRIKPKSIPLRMKTAFRIAASVAIIALMTTVTLNLYRSDKERTILGERNVLIKVGKGERASITLPDGTSVRLNSESELSYQQDFGFKNREVSLEGEGFFEVVKNEEKSFLLHTKFLDIQVLGTSFNAYTYEYADSVEIALVAGHVKVTTTSPPYQTCSINANEKVIYDKKAGKMRVESSSNTLETAWMRHELIFRSTTLKEVFNLVGRKYGFRLEVENDEILQDLYTGVFEESDVDQVMKILETHFNFEYIIKEYTIQIQSSPQKNRQCSILKQ